MKNKYKEIMRSLSKEAQWVGEDGNATCVARTEKAAWRKFKTLVRECIGDYEAREIQNEYEIGITFVNLFTEAESREHEDAEWYVSCRTETPYRAWLMSAK